jgi:uncharacterized protein (DUF1697 family)
MKYAAFLRAVNVGGRVVTMAALKRAFAALPVQDVETFIASGNVIFASAARDVAALERKAEAGLLKAFGYEVDTFIRTLDELREIARCGPFEDVAVSGRGGTVFVGFLREPLDRGQVRRLQEVSTANDEFRAAGREVLWLRRAAGRESLQAGYDLGKVLGVRTTLRNARTVRRIVEKYS